MIRYALVCDQDHAFEAWFGSSGDFDDQQARGLVECPVCASRNVAKQIMAPAVRGTKAQAPSAADAGSGQAMMMMETMARIRRHVEDTFDYMGDRFADEARAIHEGKAEERGIYGEASPVQIRELVEDGVRIAPLPPKPKSEGELN
jgi:hypothetical protein